MLTKKELQAILVHFMVNDSWEDEELTRLAINKLSQKHGYEDWIEAYHA